MAIQSIKPAGLPVIHDRAADIDIGARFHVVAVPPEFCDEAVQTFQAFTGDIERMADWLVSIGIKTVAMESTGVYWVPVYELLRARGIEVIVANARRRAQYPAARATSMTRSGCNGCMPVACFARASGPNATSLRSGPTCGCVNDTLTTPLHTSSTCRRR